MPKAIETGFLSVHFASFPIDSLVDFDLYLKRSDSDDQVLYRARELPFTAETRDRLLASKIDHLHIKTEDREKYQHFVERNLAHIVADPTAPPKQKAVIIYQAASNMMKDLLEHPDKGQNIARSADMAKNTLDFLLKGRESFFHMLSRWLKDYYTYTHCIHVCAYSVLLAQHIGISGSMLEDLATGALIHDIGKGRLAPDILAKKGPLTLEEWEEMKKHPLYGMEIARNAPSIRPLAYLPIVQHQEKYDGTGYPNGLAGADIHIFGRITAIADAFDAITSNRNYALANSHFEALKCMLKERNTHFDGELLEQFVKVLVGK